jgi:transcriptional regulator with XRE-family HTH domain
MSESKRTLSAAIAANVRAERAAKHWTQVQLGEMVGMSGATVSDIETGRRTVTANDLPLFCRAFEIGLSELVRRAGVSDLKALQLPRT